MKIPETKLQLSFILFTKKFPTMTQRHKFGVRGQGGRGRQAQNGGRPLKIKENTAGLRSKLNCKTTTKKVQLLPKDCLPFGKEENV